MGVREIEAKQITGTIRRLCIEANTILEDDVIDALKIPRALLLNSVKPRARCYLIFYLPAFLSSPRLTSFALILGGLESQSYV